jgi:hypothetical protein
VQWFDFLIIIASGAFGGLLSSIYLNDGALISPKKIELDLSDGTKRTHTHLGFWSDVFLGAGAGLIASLPLGLEFPKYIYVAMLAGFGGGSFIAKQAKLTAEEKISAQDKLPNITPTNNNASDEDEVTFELDVPDKKGES